MMKKLRDVAQKMSELQLPRSEAHDWWAVAEAVVALYRSKGNEKAIAIMEKSFEERMK